MSKIDSFRVLFQALLINHTLDPLVYVKLSVGRLGKGGGLEARFWGAANFGFVVALPVDKGLLPAKRNFQQIAGSGDALTDKEQGGKGVKKGMGIAPLLTTIAINLR